jgi:hypothetical protein
MAKPIMRREATSMAVPFCGIWLVTVARFGVSDGDDGQQQGCGWRHANLARRLADRGGDVGEPAEQVSRAACPSSAAAAVGGERDGCERALQVVLGFDQLDPGGVL